MVRLMAFAVLLLVWGCGTVNDSNGNDNSFKDPRTRPRSSEVDPQLAEGTLSRDCLLNRDPALWNALHLNAHQIQQVEELRQRMLGAANDTTNVGARTPDATQATPKGGTEGEDGHPAVTTTGEGNVKNARTGTEAQHGSATREVYDQAYMIDELKRFLSNEQLTQWRAQCSKANEGHGR